MNLKRKEKFDKWWRQNHHRHSGHYWLTKNSRRILHNYNVPPEQYSHALSIIKRYNLSEYKRLTKADSYFLYKLIHPSMNTRTKLLQSTAEFLQERAEIVNRKFAK